MSNKRKERVQGCRLPSWLPQLPETGHWVNLAPNGNTICRAKQTGRMPVPNWNGKLCRFERQICTVKASFREVEITSIAGKFVPVVMSYPAFLALALPEYTKEVKAKPAKQSKANAKPAKAKPAKAKPAKVKRITKAEADLVKFNRMKALAKSGKVAPMCAEADRIMAK